MKNLFPGLLIVGGALALLGGTDNHPPQVAASIAPAAPSVGSDNPDAHTTAASSDAHVPAAVVSSEVTASARAGDDLDAAGSATAQSHAAFSPPTLPEQMLAESNRIRANAIPPKPPQTLDERLCKAAQDQADYIATTGQLSHNVNGDPRSRAAKYGFPSGDFYSVREIIAPYALSVENAFSRWCNPPGGHYAAIISDHDLCGFGVATGPYGTMYVGVYGRESSPQPIQLTTYLSNPPAAPATKFMQCGPNGCYVVPATRYTQPQSYQQPAQQPQPRPRFRLIRRWR